MLWQNITIALGVKLVFFALAVFGDASMWMAVFADMGASLIVVFNGMRLLRFDASTSRAEAWRDTSHATKTGEIRGGDKH